LPLIVNAVLRWRFSVVFVTGQISVGKRLRRPQSRLTE
jgi:hypothetical protein